MDFARNQSQRSRTAKRLLGVRGYELAKATRLCFPLRRSSYSQSGEDLALAKYLPEKQGRYLDIGSSNPIDFSNTFAFYRRGWQGMLIDPLTVNRLLTRLSRPRDHMVQALVSSSTGQIEFFEMDPSYLSTADAEVAAHCVANGAVIHRQTPLNAIPVADLAFTAQPLMPTFASIDVEGHELEVLSSFNWHTQRPRVVLLEQWSSESRQALNDQCAALLGTQGYRLDAFCGSHNQIWVHEQWLATRPA